jgi:hypothetical protein
VTPWELARQPLAWQELALTAAMAEAEAERLIRRRDARTAQRAQARQKRGRRHG